MDQETREMFQTIINGMESMEQRLKDYMREEIKSSEERMREEIKSSEERMREEIKSSEQRTRVYIENDVSKRIDALFDGYKLTHEKQWELERKMQEPEARLERLESLQNVG